MYTIMQDSCGQMSKQNTQILKPLVILTQAIQASCLKGEHCLVLVAGNVRCYANMRLHWPGCCHQPA